MVPAFAQDDEDSEESKGRDKWDTTQARGDTREISFATSEGTFMSSDVSPDGQWVVFDLLAHIYRVSISGGEAECLTQDSGVATNYHPTYSPDGNHIAFVSDRKGQSNLWIMNADGSDPKAVFTSLTLRVVEPAWTADSQYIIVRRSNVGRRGGAGGGGSGIYMYHKEGGQGVELISSEQVTGTSWMSPSLDGKYVYYQRSAGRGGVSGQRNVLAGAYQLGRFRLEDGDVMNVTGGQAGQQSRGSSGGGYAPEISPDGRSLAFARRIPDGTISYKGLRFGPRTALFIRDLETGSERMVMDPIEQDMAEGMKTLRALPGYSWTPDGRSIVITQGGKLRRLDVDSGEVSTIDFTAQVQRTISEMAYRSFRLDDGPLNVRFMRWATASPDGRRLAFQAVGKIWIQDLPSGTVRRLTPASFEPGEYSPAWSRDGRTIAFTSWNEQERGHLWTISATGGQPRQISPEPGEYVQPVWSPDGSEILVSRGSGVTARGRDLASNLWYELARIPASGGQFTVVARVDGGGGRGPIVRASYSAEGRVYFPARGKPTEGNNRPGRELVSVRADDGRDRKVHLTFPFSDEMAISPDGKKVAFQEGDNVFLVSIPPFGVGGKAIRVEKKRGQVPVKQLSKEGGMFPAWRGNDKIEYSSANKYYIYDVASEETTDYTMELTVDRDIPSGSIALTGARIITLDSRKQVVEQGDIVVRSGRIVCVGRCDTSGVDQVVDAAGKTIMPGLVDMHAHHYREHQGLIPEHSFETAIYLAYGVTTNLDNSMWSQNIFPAAEMIEAGKMIGPRTFSTGDPLYRGDAARQNELTSYEVTEQNIKRLKSWGAVSLKQYMQPRRDQRQWVSDVARKEGLMVTAEGSDLAYNLGMIMDGQTAFEHPMSYMPLYSDAAKFFGLAKAVYSPTFIVGGSAAWNEEFFFQESDVWKDPKLQRFTPWRALVPHLRRRVLRPETDYSFPLIAQGMADIIAEGGYGAIGSHGQQHGIGSHWELWMVAAAMGPMGALDVASRQGAHFLGVEEDTGSIQVGKLADLVVLNSNPLENIRNSTDIRYVMKAGTLFDGDTLDELWPDQVPFGPYYWLDESMYRTDDRPTNYWDMSKDERVDRTGKPRP